MRRVVIVIFSVVVLFILFVVLCTFVRRPYETVILNRFGSLITQEQQARIIPGYNWYFKYPTDSAVPMDTRLHLYTSPVQQVNTGGSQTIAIRTYAAWRITDPVTFYNTTTASDKRAEAYLGAALSSAVNETVTGRPLDDIFNTDPAKLKTPEMEAEIARRATEGSKDKDHPLTGMKELGVEIVQVGFSRMAFPPGNADAVYSRMAQEQNTKAVGFQQQGAAEASKIISDGKAQAEGIIGEATKKAEQIRGEADAQAVDILAGVQKSAEARDFYQYWKSLDFVKTSLTKNTYLVLPSDSPFLKSLFVEPENGQFVPSTTAPAAGGHVTPLAPKSLVIPEAH